MVTVSSSNPTPQQPFEFTGDFVNDYIHYSKYLNVPTLQLKHQTSDPPPPVTAEIPKKNGSKANLSGNNSGHGNGLNNSNNGFKQAIIIDTKSQVTIRSINIDSLQTAAITSCLSMHTVSSLTKLNLWRCRITADGLKSIAELVMKGPVDRLQIDENANDLFTKPSECSIALADMVGLAGRLTHLSLRSNDIGDMVAKSMFDALGSNQSLLTLNLWNNHIRDGSMPALALSMGVNRTLTALSLGKNCITDEGISILVKGLIKHELSPAEKDLMSARESVKKEDDTLAKAKVEKKPAPDPKKGGASTQTKKTDTAAGGGLKKNSSATNLKLPSKKKPDGPGGSIVDINGVQFTRGSRVLSYLNLSNNELSSISAQTICQMLNEQAESGICDGIRTLVLEGNPSMTSQNLKEIGQLLVKKNSMPEPSATI